MLTRDHLAALDRRDPLARFRDQFVLPEGVVYLVGNSLGALPRTVPQRVEEALLDHWGQDLIRAWNRRGWIELPLAVGEKIGRLIGARPGEVAVADSTSVNLFKLLAAALELRPERRVIVSEADNFPSDLYMIQGLVDLLGGGCELRLAAPGGLAEALADDVAVVSLSHVNYRTAALHDLPAVTAAVHARGALVLWDLAHSAGTLEIDLGGCGADLAVGCGYKFLSGGPGAPAFLYVAQRLQDRARQPLTGWFGHAAPFDFDPVYRPASGIARHLCGTPPVLSLVALDAALDLVLAADLGEVRAKSERLGDLFLELVAQECPDSGFSLVSPREAALRGSQVSLAHAHGYAIMQALIARGVIGDFRAPDVLRFGLAPLYLRYVDLWQAVQALRQVMAEEEWRAPAHRRRGVVT